MLCVGFFFHYTAEENLALWTDCFIDLLLKLLNQLSR